MTATTITIMMVIKISKIKAPEKVAKERTAKVKKDETKIIRNISLQIPVNQLQKIGKASPFIGVKNASVGAPTQRKSIVGTSMLTTLLPITPPELL